MLCYCYDVVRANNDSCAGGRCDGGLDIKIIAAIVVGCIAGLIILILLIVLIIYLVKRSKHRKNQAGSYVSVHLMPFAQMAQALIQLLEVQGG